MKIDKNLLNAVLRQDLSSFIGKVFHTINPNSEYHPNWHIDLIANYLNEVEKGNIKRLIINIPPRSLKSICVSVAWPAWLMGHNPSKRIMVACYSSVLSIKHSIDCRLILSNNWYKELFPKCRLSKQHNQKSKFLTTNNGFRFATSVGGSITGEGGDILIIDDPHNPTQINSPKYRKKVIEWFETTFVTRLNNKQNGAIILVMQRLHDEDLTSHLIASGGWTLLKIPAIANIDYLYEVSGKKYNYYKNNLLNFGRDQQEFLYEIEREIGTRNFAAQFLQEPLPSSFNMLSLEDITFYHEIPQFQYYVLSWDTAIKISENSDYSVGICWGIIDTKYYLVSMIRKKMSYPELKKAIEKQIAKYSPKYVLIEDKSSGQSLIQDLLLANYKGIKAIKPMQDKVTRFASVIPLFQDQRVLIINKTSVNQEIIRELTNFPNNKHDDIVDAISQFLNFTKTNNNQPMQSHFIRSF
ncbi:MAG: phage terminase large subunit [Rickettsiaceae bacterium]|nr:phage terminase large subunit [Rickettsiaceae bacterium]